MHTHNIRRLGGWRQRQECSINDRTILLQGEPLGY
jgi:hypothetical protein